jgi:hypothetical protein
MPARVTLQLARHVDPEHGRVALSAVTGVVRVSQVAPDQEDPELVRIFVLDIDPTRTASTLNALVALGITESCEPSPRRAVRPRPH